MKQIMPITFIALLVIAVALLTKNWLISLSVDTQVLLIGNALLYSIHLLTASFYKKTLHNNNVQAFIRGVYTGMIIKLFFCIIAAFVYIYIADKELNKPALFICMFLYLVYTFTEVTICMKQLKSASKRK